MIQKTEYKNICWWCGSKADSREHTHKKTDFKRVFGNPPYPEVDQPIKALTKGGYRNIQGPNSKEIKFKPVLCKKCNNERSQSLDLAYDKFINWVETNTNQIIENETIDFKLIFGNDYLEDKLNVLRYYTKHFCCRLAENSISISREIINFLNGYGNLQYLIIKFEIRYDILAMALRHHERGNSYPSLYKASLKYFYKEEVEDEIDFVYTFYNYRWFRIHFQYSERITSTDPNFDWYDEYNEADIIDVPTFYIIPPEKYQDCTDNELYELIEQYKKRELAEDQNNFWLGI
ncbi:MAG: hypothetical protein R8P61_37065 [Bacteroidia bacterium]|nr:hypothetical protein [Bacteroidia bacterium]